MFKGTKPAPSFIDFNVPIGTSLLVAVDQNQAQLK
jgi:hypothetical protein